MRILMKKVKEFTPGLTAEMIKRSFCYEWCFLGSLMTMVNQEAQGGMSNVAKK